MNYYNEWDAFAAEWLRELIKDGLIPDGEVDNRSITDVEASELKGFTQCHFFAGIGGWSRALQIAGWSPDRTVWTGSPPCQSFSVAGKGKGKDDERHLWPVFFNLIRECQPTAVFGEQVAAAIRHGWLDDLQDDFEAEGYASAAVVLPAGSIGAFHKRDRLFFTAKRVAYSDKLRQSRPGQVQQPRDTEENSEGQVNRALNASGIYQSVADSGGSGREGRSGSERSEQREIGQDGSLCSSASVGDSEHDGLYGTKIGRGAFAASDNNAQGENIPSESEGAGGPQIAGNLCLWENPRIIYCRDGKYRPIPTEPALFPLADGISNRVGILRGAGNAIVPQAAAEIIKAVM